MSEQTNELTLVGYGDRADIRELAYRYKVATPGGRKLDDGEAIALAQVCLAHGLDGTNGEAWIIPGSGPMVGIKGLRKMARRQAAQENSAYWIDISQADPDVYGVPTGIVYVATLRDSATLQAWAKGVNALTTAGIPYKDAVEMCGPAPVVIGVGIATPDEKSKMGIHQRARKRAEADAIKQRYDVNFATFTVDEPEDVIEAEFTDRPAPHQIGGNGSKAVAREHDQPVKTEAELMSELGF